MLKRLRTALSGSIKTVKSLEEDVEEIFEEVYQYGPVSPLRGRTYDFMPESREYHMKTDLNEVNVEKLIESIDRLNEFDIKVSSINPVSLEKIKKIANDHKIIEADA